MKIIEAEIPDIKIIELDTFPDNRGYFFETYHEQRYKNKGLSSTFLQDNVSYSKQNVLRGLHFQQKNPQGKLIMPIVGQIYDVAVDIRTNSPTFGKWVGVSLSENHPRQLFLPEGFAHGFCVISQYAIVHYKCTNFYDPGDNCGIIWNDPDIAIDWPIEKPIVSQRDNQLPAFKEYIGKL